MRTIEERFNKCVELIPFTDCWIWNGSCNKNGYGTIGIRNKQMRSHRLSYELHKGPIPQNMEVCHSCDNPICVNPNHLWLGTHRENMQDMKNKGRHIKNINIDKKELKKIYNKRYKNAHKEQIKIYQDKYNKIYYKSKIKFLSLGE